MFIRDPAGGNGSSPASRGRAGASVVAEALGYLGGSLALVGGLLIAGRYWSDVGTAGRLLLTGALAGALAIAGALLRGRLDPALARLRDVLWLVSSAASALFGGVLATDGLNAADETVVLACAVAVAATSGAFWWWRRRVAHELAFLAATAVVVGAAGVVVATVGVAGLAVLVFSAGLLALGLRRRIPAPPIAEAVGGLAVLVGSPMTAEGWQGAGFLVAMAAAGALAAVSVVPGLAPERIDERITGVLSAIALLQAAPGTLGYFSQDAGAATGLATWAAGAVLVFVGARRLVRIPRVTESVGCLALLGGAAITGVQWHGFAPLFGVATAVGLLAVGMLPGQVLLSVFGSLGLLVDVPWTVGRFFPSGSAPLAVLTAGVVLLVVALLLTRTGGTRPRPTHP